MMVKAVSLWLKDVSFRLYHHPNGDAAMAFDIDDPETELLVRTLAER